MSKKMRAAQISKAGGDWELVEHDIREPGVGEVRVKVEACGICGTDARTFFNGDPKAPVPWVLGHEPVGTLVEVGPEADLPPGVAEGDRVFLGSILTCGECRWCTEGFQNLCEHHLLYGYDPFPGAYANYAGVPAIATKNLIPLPHDLPSGFSLGAGRRWVSASIQLWHHRRRCRPCR